MREFNYIWTRNDNTEKDSYADFKTEFSFDGEKTYLLLTCDSNFEASVNGVKVAFGECADYPDYKLYYKTDTHWNGLGAFVGFRELLKAIDIELPSLDNLQISKADGYAGDLTGMMGLSKYMNYDSHYAVSGFPIGEGAKLVKNEDSRDNYLVYTNTGMDERRICVLRDSYTTAMTDYIASQFNEAHLIHRLYYKPEMLDAVNPDVVILQIVERDVIVLLDFVL